MKLALAAALCCLILPASLSAEDSVEDRLRRLEDELVSLRKENEQLRRDLGLEAVARKSDVKTSGHADSIQVGGLLQAQSESGDRGDARFSDANSRIYLRRARVSLSGRVNRDFDFRTELEMAGSLTNASGYRAQLTDAYLTWTRFDAANVRVGQFKTPFGFEQLYLDPRVLVIERSLVNDRLTPGRQLGVQLSGKAQHERVTWAAGLFNGSGTNQNFNDNDRFMTAARVTAVPFSGSLLGNRSRWTIGANGFRTTDASVTLAPELGFDSTPSTPAKDNLFAGRRTGAGVDTQFEFGPFELWGEYLRSRFDPTDRIPSRSFRADGWYQQASYFVIPDKLQVVGRVETFDPDNLAAGVSTRSMLLGGNWYFKQHDLKLQVDWMRSRVPGLDSAQQKVIARLQAAF